MARRCTRLESAHAVQPDPRRVQFVPLVLGLAFLGVARSRRPKLRRRGPWLMVVTAAVMALLASEAVFINKWASATAQGRATPYLLVFTCTTVAAWFLTALAFWDFVLGS
jgi:hypothetical protein